MGSYPRENREISESNWALGVKSKSMPVLERSEESAKISDNELSEFPKSLISFKGDCR